MASVIGRWDPSVDGARFWANVLTMALRGKNGEVQGFARVVRDFSKRHSMEEKLRRGGVLLSFSWPKIRRLDGFFK